MKVQVKEFRNCNAELIDCLNEIAKHGGRIISYDEILEPHWCGLDEEYEYHHEGWNVTYEQAENVLASNKFWIARDNEEHIRRLWLFTDKPQLNTISSWWSRSKSYNIPSDLFPEITYENSPKQIEIKILDDANTSNY